MVVYINRTAIWVRLVPHSVYGYDYLLVSSWHWNPQNGRPPVEYVNICIEGPCVISIQSARAPLAVSGGQPLFTLGLPIFSLSLEYVLSLSWGTSTSVFFYFFLLNISFEGHKKSSTISFRFKGLYDEYWPSWKRLSFDIFVGCPFDVLLGGNLSKHAGCHSLTTEACTPLGRSVWYGGLEAHWGYLRYVRFILL